MIEAKTNESKRAKSDGCSIFRSLKDCSKDIHDTVKTYSYQKNHYYILGHFQPPNNYGRDIKKSRNAV